MAWPHPTEDLVDGLLSHMWGGPFGVLDSVRNSLHDLLHPFAAAADTAMLWVWQHAEDAWNYAVKLYYQAVDFAIFLRDQVVTLAHTLVAGAVGAAQALVNGVVGYAQQLYNMAVGAAQSLADNVRGYAEALYNHAVGFAQSIWDTVYRDVVAPIERDVANMADTVFGWAKPLLDVVEGAAHWVDWVTNRLIPDLLHVWKTITTEDPTDIERVMSRFVRSGQATSHNVLRRYVSTNGAGRADR